MAFAPGVTTVSGLRSFLSTSGDKHPTALREVVLPDGVTRIDDRAFEGCTALTTINFPTTITDFGAGAFYNCSSLTGSLKLTSAVSVIGEGPSTGAETSL